MREPPPVVVALVDMTQQRFPHAVGWAGVEWWEFWINGVSRLRSMAGPQQRGLFDADATGVP